MSDWPDYEAAVEHIKDACRELADLRQIRYPTTVDVREAEERFIAYLTRGVNAALGDKVLCEIDCGFIGDENRRSAMAALASYAEGIGVQILQAWPLEGDSDE